jgi:hypothetical protein
MSCYTVAKFLVPKNHCLKTNYTPTGWAIQKTLANRKIGGFMNFLFWERSEAVSASNTEPISLLLVMYHDIS